MEFILRPATPDDAAALTEIDVLAWKIAYRGIISQDFLDRLTVEDKLARFEQTLHHSRASTVLAEDEKGRVLGYATYGHRRDGPEEITGELWALYLRAEAEGTGLAKKLVKHTAKHLHAEGHRNFCVWTLEENQKARGFYEHLGGAWVAEKTFEIDDVPIREVCYGWLDMTDILDE